VEEEADEKVKEKKTKDESKIELLPSFSSVVGAKQRTRWMMLIGSVES